MGLCIRSLPLRSLLQGIWHLQITDPKACDTHIIPETASQQAHLRMTVIRPLFLSLEIINESSWNGEVLSSSQRDICYLNITSKGKRIEIHKAKEKPVFNIERIKTLFGGWGRWLRVRGFTAAAEDWSSVPTTHIGQLTTTWNSRSRRPNAFCLLCAFTKRNT